MTNARTVSSARARVFRLNLCNLTDKGYPSKADHAQVPQVSFGPRLVDSGKYRRVHYTAVTDVIVTTTCFISDNRPQHCRDGRIKSSANLTRKRCMGVLCLRHVYVLVQWYFRNNERPNRRKSLSCIIKRQAKIKKDISSDRSKEYSENNDLFRLRYSSWDRSWDTKQCSRQSTVCYF